MSCKGGGTGSGELADARQPAVPPRHLFRPQRTAIRVTKQLRSLNETITEAHAAPFCQTVSFPWEYAGTGRLTENPIRLTENPVTAPVRPDAAG